jgi:hypothetical protein
MYACVMKSIRNTIWDTTVLVLVMGVIYEVHRWDSLRRHDIDVRIKSHEDWFRHSGNIKVIASTLLRGCRIDITDRKDLRYIPFR